MYSVATSNQHVSICVSMHVCNYQYVLRFPSLLEQMSTPLLPLCLLLLLPPLLSSLLLPKTQDNAVQPPNWVSLKRFIGMLLNILTFF